MLAGYLPFDEPQMHYLYKSIVYKQPSYPPHFLYDVIKLLRSMLQKDPTKRPTIKQYTWFRFYYQQDEYNNDLNCEEIILANSSSSNSNGTTKSNTSGKKNKVRATRTNTSSNNY